MVERYLTQKSLMKPLQMQAELEKRKKHMSKAERKSDLYSLAGGTTALSQSFCEVCCCCPRDCLGQIDRAKIVKCKFRSRSNDPSNFDKLRDKSSEWKYVSVEVKSLSEVDGKSTYTV